jgi:hypothetical protein
VLVGLTACPVAPALCDDVESADATRRTTTQRVTIHATEAKATEVLRMIGNASDVKIVYSTKRSPSVTLDVTEVPVDQAIRAVTDAAGLVVRRQGDVYIVERVDDLADITLVPGEAVDVGWEVNPEALEQATMAYRLGLDHAGAVAAAYGALEGQQGNWEAWRGDLPDDVARAAFEPTETATSEDGTRLQGTLSAMVEDLKAGGVDITLDPTLTVGHIQEQIGIPWYEGATVDHVALCLAVATAADRTGVSIVRHKGEEGEAADRLRVVPANRWGVGAGNVVTWTRPNVVFDQFGNRKVQWVLPQQEFTIRGDVPILGELPVLGELFQAQANVPEPLQKRIDLELKDVPLEQALEAISEELGHPITLEEGIKRDTNVTVSLKQAPIHQVLQTVLLQLGLMAKYEKGEDFDGVTVVPLADFFGTATITVQPGANH